MIPTTRDEFKMYCLKKLGHPVIQINLDDSQIDDRIDEALELFTQYHMDGSEQVYYKYVIQQDDITNNYIVMPATTIGVTKIFPYNSQLATNSIFNIRYQIALNDLYSLTNVDMVPYYMAMQHVALLEQLLVGEKPIRYNQSTNILHIDMDWSLCTVGEYLLVDCYQQIDPSANPNVWKNVWLQKYATALIKNNWGSVLTKFSGMPMPGGMTFNGQSIFNESIRELDNLKDELINTWSLPVSIFIG